VNPMPDNWGYVLAAYAVAAAAFLGYWRYLAARARSIRRRRTEKP
jgi:hypothetical protein